MKPSVEFLDWGTVDYADALERQRELFERLIREKDIFRRSDGCTTDGTARSDAPEADHEKGAGWLVFCEHPPVYTLGRSGRAENLLVTEEFLREKGASLHHTERGGDITFHGPGQIVAYPILDLERLGIGLRDYIAALEQAVIETVTHFRRNADSGFSYAEVGRIPGKTGVWVKGDAEVGRIPGKTGVWVKDKLRITNYELRDRKICAIGVKSSRFVTMHGLALNVATDLRWFELINPCGFVGGAVTSMERETGQKVAMQDVKKVLRDRLFDNLKI